MKSDYIALTKYLEQCEFDEVTLSFDKIEGILGVLQDSARKYHSPWSRSGPIGTAAYRAGYHNTASLNSEAVRFFKENNNNSKSFVKIKISQSRRVTSLHIDEAIRNIKKYHKTTEDRIHTRFRSWVHCYKAFRENRHDPDKAEFLCLHLAWFLASWGIPRNSFLLNRDYRVHRPLINEIQNGNLDALFTDDHTPDMIPNIMKIETMISKSYDDSSVTPALITTILSGIFGCTPVYDNYFQYATRKYSICSSYWSAKSLGSLWQYYNYYETSFENLRNELIIEGIRYTPMKLLDMCLWQIGYDAMVK